MAIYFEASRGAGANSPRKPVEGNDIVYVEVPEVFSLESESRGQQQKRLVLENKLAEYRARMLDDDFSVEVQKSASYKAFILGKLLEKGSVTVKKLRNELKEEAKGNRKLLGKHADNFDDKLFNNAVGVIYDYLIADGMDAIGGTGLIERVG